jgi:modification target Cys-rich repeat protein
MSVDRRPDAGLDEFDLDLVWGELSPHGSLELYLPTTNEQPGETCDSHAPTCPNTCRATCPDTCRGTCPATCRNTCEETCRRTCPDTCRPCQTQAQTHCPTEQPGCMRR